MSVKPSYSQEISEKEIQVSEAAREQLALLESESGDGTKGIRIYVQGGGCGGMQYGMTYANEFSPYDRFYRGDGFTLVVDAIAVQYLNGCDIDYTRNGINESFVFNNVFQSVGGSGRCGGCGGH